MRLNPDVPPDLERVITKCLEKDRNLRYQHASDIRTDLQRLRRDTESVKLPGTARSAMPIRKLLKVIVTSCLVVFTLALAVAATLWLRGRNKGSDRSVENLALRDQIGVLQRSSAKRPKLSSGDRLFWICLTCLWRDWRSALAIVKPDSERVRRDTGRATLSAPEAVEGLAGSAYVGFFRKIGNQAILCKPGGLVRPVLLEGRFGSESYRFSLGEYCFRAGSE